jgi:hypothetical protein
MPLLELMTSSGLGSLLGIRHALEPDHLAAVSTLVSNERDGRRAALLGVCWGIGHTTSLVLVGAALVFARAKMPSGIADAFEFAVAVMLVALGLRAIYLAARQGPLGPTRVHHHGRRMHQHAGSAAHLHLGRWTLARRPLIVGAVHGLAGSGALTALVVATLPSTLARLSYMVLFGLGSTLGMAVLSGMLGWPLARLGRHVAVARGISALVGCASIVLGIFWGYPLAARLLETVK